MKTKEQIDILLADAKSGDAGAQNDLGCAYGSGDGVEKNFQTAFSWFMRSAEQGNMYAQHNVGLYYKNGTAVKKDISLAVQWYEKSASQGFAKAAFALGEIYEKGYQPNTRERVLLINSFTANPQEAFYWYRKASGYHEMARFNLARCYELGIGTEKNLHYAMHLYKHCKKEAQSLASERIEIMKDTYDYLKDTRIKNIDLFFNNPFRILGVYTNEGIKAERASQSKMLALTKVGKFPSSSIDNIIPSTISQYLLYWKNKQDVTDIPRSRIIDLNEYREIKQGTLAKDSYTDWSNFENKNQQWSDLPNRKEIDINKAIDQLAIDTERIKYALFWFCCVTEEDKKALQLLAEQKWYEAEIVWQDCENFSSLINTSVLYWIERKDKEALKKVLEVINDDKYRQDFLTHVCKSNSEITETDLKHIFWDAIYSNFSEADITESWVELVEYCRKYISLLSLYISEDDLNYIKEKQLSKLKKPLMDSLQLAEMKDKDNFEECRKAYYEIIKIAPYRLLCIGRFLGKDDYRYKMLCDDTADKILHYAIYNNNNNKDWSSPATSLYLATNASKIAIDPTLKNKCDENIKIFTENKKIATSEKILENIENAFSKLGEDVESITFEQIKKLIKDTQLYIECLKTELTKDSTDFQNISNNVVNRIINIIIQVCNKNKDMITAELGEDCLKQLKTFSINTQTLNRINTNIKILVNNSHAALMRGDLGLPKYTPKSYKETMSKSEINKRRIKKFIMTIISIASIVGIWYYLSSNYNYLLNNLNYILYIGIGLIVSLAIFILSMWGLELKNDPFDNNIEWLDKTIESIYDIYNSLMGMGARDGKTYSWPFALPFGLLGLVLFLISFPIRWITKLATLIK